MSIKATDVFTPGSFPLRTYVERVGEHLEANLRDAISTPGQIVSLIGPSKSGKTVLVERVVGRDLLITITGAGIYRAEEVWTRVLDWMDAPTSREHSTSVSADLSGEASGGASVSLPLIGNVAGEAKGGIQAGVERNHTSTFERGGLNQAVKEIADSDFVVLVDDFHYMPRDVQAEAAKTLKEGVRLGVKVCTAAVLHRGDDLVRANPELRGRVRAIDLTYWGTDDLRKIATAGFAELNAIVPDDAINAFVREAAGSPQLMQLICLNACFVIGARVRSMTEVKYGLDHSTLQRIFEQVSASTDFRSLVDVLDSGPKTRGIERKLYTFMDQTQGDVYRATLKAVAANPPQLTFTYEELLSRTAGICVGDHPVGSSVVGTCHHMSKLALEKFPNERAIDWDEQKQILDIPDPYLLFYLRWSGRLQQAEP